MHGTISRASHAWLPVLAALGVALFAGWGWQRFRRPWILVPPLVPVVDAGLPRVLVFTRTMKYRHRSIPDGVLAVQDVGAGRWITDHTEDPGTFTTENLARYAAVVFLSTTGDVLDEPQQRAFEAWIRAGGGYAGVHAAADTEYAWPWYGELVGAWFRDHTSVTENAVRVEDPGDASMRGMPNPWVHTDEWYAFRTNPRPFVHVLGSIDDARTGASGMGGDHPITWKRRMDAGRAWYTGMGHTKESFADPVMRGHLQGGIAWAAGLVNDDGTPIR
jgi:cytochrome c